MVVTRDPQLAKLKRCYSDAGPGFFKNSKLHSSPGFFQIAGTILAMPYPVKGIPQKVEVLDGATEYSSKFRQNPECYSSMANKPLCVYDPLSYRSRNRQSTKVSGAKRGSSLSFDDGLFVDHNRRFVTSHRNFYQGMPCDPRSNDGIISDQYALRVEREQK
eukprot:GEMP01033576.1.p2 GENE.GEMP01033576.1~~GEMP01033576.1.p2  ORF type:complete len:161 (+),score=23.14 GEMP01033576.1:57-539(+)